MNFCTYFLLNIYYIEKHVIKIVGVTQFSEVQLGFRYKVTVIIGGNTPELNLPDRVYWSPIVRNGQNV
jgi:hypothetical protein